MSLSQTAWRDALTPRPGFWLRQMLPRGLMARAFLIVLVPVLGLQIVIAYLFFERHYEQVTQRLARGVAGQVALLEAVYAETEPDARVAKVVLLANDTLGFKPEVLPSDQRLPPSSRGAIADAIIADEFARLASPASFDTNFSDDEVAVRLRLEEGILQLRIERKRVIATNVHIFILWMVASGLVFLGVALLFLRNQVRPILRLAVAAERFGRGQDSPSFRPQGATEVRRAAMAMLDMRDRLVRSMQTRMEILAGVSHDLRTPLTRMKLELAMMPPDLAAALKADVDEMERLVDEYLAFVRGDTPEAPADIDLKPLLAETVQDAGRKFGRAPALEAPFSIKALVRHGAIRRCVGNLIDNAMRHGTKVSVTLRRRGFTAEILIDDDGPGIPVEHREDAFQPFRQLAGNGNGGYGLGLAIARDAARAHGGDVTLDDSPLGGLRAVVSLPL